MFSNLDSEYMALALRLAEQGLYSTSPNPRVGCVLVHDGKIVGTGWHQRAGEPHAEVLAWRAAGYAARGTTAYVTLEPCSHFGRTPPCADGLIAAGVARVVIAMQDPNPLVSGKGIEKLRAAGIVVESGLMEAAARELNLGFVSRMKRGIPYVRSKIASSLDGRTALKNGVSQWITGAEARRDVQHWRARSCAVLTGINTILADDAQLNVRDISTSVRPYPSTGSGLKTEVEGCDVTASMVRQAHHERAIGIRQPLRVLLDSQLRIPLNAKILLPSPASVGGAGGEGSVLIYTATQNPEKISALEQLGVSVCVLANAHGRVDLSAMLKDLAQRGINEVLVEAGSTLNGALLQAHLVDELLFYLAPQMLGDAARGMANLGELIALNQRVELQWQDVRMVGNDLRVQAKICRVG
jgi:diaminohydroxyphosphoribosylaminopyrimidine deaminase/5-amino-6-(5-phosphoribosylamino)uracil reductase